MLRWGRTKEWKARMTRIQVPARRQRAANDNGFPVPVPARCREYGNGNYEALRPLSPVADMSSHTPWSAMGHNRHRVYHFLFASAFAPSRALSTKSCATGLSVVLSQNQRVAVASIT
jgi:hypothetical protein